MRRTKSRFPQILLVAAMVALAALVLVYKLRGPHYSHQAAPPPARLSTPPSVQPRLLDPPALRPALTVTPPAVAPPMSDAPPVTPTDLAPQFSTPEQEGVMHQAASERDLARRTKEGRYNLPTDRYLRMVNLELTADQQRQLQALKDALKPRMDASLENIWNRSDELNKQLTALMNNKTMEEQNTPYFQAQAGLIYEQLRVANDQANAITGQFNEDYQVQVQAILTPEQRTRYGQAVGVMMGNFSPAAKK